VDKKLRPNGLIALTGYMYPEPQVEGKTEEIYKIIVDWFAEHKTLWPDNHEYLVQFYKNLPLPYSNHKRVDAVPTDFDGSLFHLIGHLRSRAAISTLEERDPEKAERIIGNIQTDMVNVLGTHSLSPEDTKMIIRFNYFLIMSSKPNDQ